MKLKQDKPENYTHVLPNDLDAESAIVGALLQSDSYAISVLNHIKNSEVFYEPEHKEIYEAVEACMIQGQKIEAIAVAMHLRSKGSSIMPAQLLGYSKYLPASSNIPKLSAYLNDLYSKRVIIQGSEKLKQEATDKSVSSEELIQSVLSLADSAQGEEVDTSLDYLSMKEEVWSRQDKGQWHIKTGFQKLDDRLGGGLAPGTLTVLGARPGMGKTDFLIHVLDNNIENNISSLFLSLEMIPIAVIDRLVLKRINRKKGTEYTPDDIKNNKELRDIISEEIRDIQSKGLLHIATCKTLPEIRIKARLLKQKHDIKFICLDYLERVQVKGQATREREVGLASSTCLDIAQDTECAFLLLSQLSRKVEERGNKQPQLSDLRYSGGIEQDAENVIFLYRPSYYDIQEDDLGNTHCRLDVLTAKAREGSTGGTHIYYNPATKQHKDWNENEIEILHESPF